MVVVERRTVGRKKTIVVRVAEKVNDDDDEGERTERHSVLKTGVLGHTRFKVRRR